MPTIIRPAVIDDLDALLVLYRHLNPADEVLPPEIARDRLRTMLAHPGLTLLCAFEGEAMVSSCTLFILPNLTRRARPYALIENVVTHGAHRQQGHGHAVIRDAVDRAFDADCYKVMLMTGRSDPGVLHFYESCGFEQTKTGFQIRQKR